MSRKKCSAMNIQPNSIYNISMSGTSKKGSSKDFWKNFQQKVLDKIPNKTFKENDKIIHNLKKYNNIMSKPMENRLIMGATALLTQPAIDYYNHRVDDETRTVARNRTIAKIIACTSVGAFVRWIAYTITDKMTNIKSNKKYSTRLLPEKFKDELLSNIEYLKNYKSAVSTILALCLMSITNILLDAPLTAYFTNKLNESTKSLKNKPDKNMEGLKYE